MWSNLHLPAEQGAPRNEGRTMLAGDSDVVGAALIRELYRYAAHTICIGTVGAAGLPVNLRTQSE